MSARPRRAGSLVAAAVTTAVLTSASAFAQELAFVACPIVRDTRTVPCWLTEYRGETYYLGIQTDVSAEFNPPSLGHRILVEGKADAAKPRICGGIVVQSPVVSIINDIADDCRTQLPSDDRYQLPFEPPRPPGPSKGRLAYDYGPPPAPPKPPFSAKSFTVPYDFDGLVGFKTPRFLTPIVDYARDIGAMRIEVTGYRNAVKLTDGTILAEQAPLARQRAEQVAELLKGAGLKAQRYDVRWKDEADIGGADKRRVVVTVAPR